MKIFFISGMGFLTSVLVIVALGNWINKDKKKIEIRIKRLKGITEQSDEVGVEKNKGIFISVNKIIDLMEKILKRKGIIKPLEEKMLKADIPLRGEEYLLIWLMCILVPGFVIFTLTQNLVAGIIFCLLGAISPDIVVKVTQQRRLKKLNSQLSDALSILANSLRAGYSFIQSLELVSHEMPDPIGKEFARTFREINLGTTTEEALNNLTSRIPSEDLELIVTAVLIQRQIGGNLAEVLDKISHTIRERIRIQGEIKTMTAQGKISGIIIGLMPPFLILVILMINYEYMMPLFNSTIGRILLMGSIVSEMIGVLIIRKVIAIDM